MSPARRKCLARSPPRTPPLRSSRPSCVARAKWQVRAGKLIVAARFKDKTKNRWEDRADFVKHPNKYDLVDQDYEDAAGGSASDAGSSSAAPMAVDGSSAPAAAPPASTLPDATRRLISLISVITCMVAVVLSLSVQR